MSFLITYIGVDGLISQQEFHSIRVANATARAYRAAGIDCIVEAVPE